MTEHRRPPWWPEGEAFPQAGADARRTRARFFRRMFMAFVAFFILSVALATALVIAVANAFGAALSFHPAGLLVVFVLVLLFGSMAGRAVRGSVRPLADLVEAAGRVETGDYAVRVRERGPREMRGLARAFNAMSARLERSEGERRRLLADVTHELRNPLAIMQGNVEALIDGVHPADAEHLGAILDEIRILSRLIDDLRTLSLAEAGALALHRETVDLGTLATDAVRSFAPQADASGIALGTEVEAGLPAVDADPLRVREVLANVIGNALRHTPRGGSVTVAVASASPGLAISVRDTGSGIEPEVLPHIFERFARSKGSPGAGLGLAIAKSIVTAHGGEITATSESGRGTEIRITLPAAPAASPGRV